MDTPKTLVINGTTYVAVDDTTCQTESESVPRSLPSAPFTLMSPSAVDRLVGWSSGRCAQYIRSGLMEYVQVPGSRMRKVTPQIVMRFIEEHTSRETGPFGSLVS